MNSKWVFVGFCIVAAAILFVTYKIDIHRELPYSDTYGWGALGFLVLGGLLAIFKK